MDIKTRISPKREIRPTIYAYITPTNSAKDGWIKIGYTERDADLRIKEQTHTAGLKAQKLWEYEARFNGGGYFSDKDFHTYIEKQGIKNEKGTEWYFFNSRPEKAKELFQSFVFKDYSEIQKGQELSYALRAEQEAAVVKTLSYIKAQKGKEFLWNAKPRFGKTLSTYDLIRKLNAENVLIVTNRPSIANSWFDDFEKFIAWQTDFKFVSESDSLKDRPTLTRDEFANHVVSHHDSRQLAFLSLQDLKGSKYFGGNHDKLRWVSTLKWDLLVIDEAHEGVDTFKTDTAFENIQRDFTLHLSGTPFKAIAKGTFSDEAIYNWSYADEQEAKLNWDGEETNPYEGLPALNMFTYQMSRMITDEVSKKAQIGEREIDFAFDLNEFFATKDNGDFEHEEDVLKWLETLTKNEKYPFSTEELRNELKHTFWVLHRVSSVKALEKILRNHDVFKDYKIIIAAGDGLSDIDDVKGNESSLIKVREAIANNDKTITLSVGQLTTGVTIPEWSAVMMLSNIKSPALYMQAAFRSQNPHEWTVYENEKEIRYRKENSYVFDFSPERTLIVFDEFANNLLSETSSGGGTSENREENIKRLLNFFPVIGEDNEGQMIELDVNQVLTIPKMIKATEVVRRGFMSNLLFANISGIFQAPQAVLDILDKLEPESQGKLVTSNKKIDLEEIELDDDDNVVVDVLDIDQTKAHIFGDKVYEVEKVIPKVTIEKGGSIAVEKFAKEASRGVMLGLEDSLNIVKGTFDLTNPSAKKIESKFSEEIERTAEKVATSLKIDLAHKNKEYENKLKSAHTQEEVESIQSEWTEVTNTVTKEFQKKIEEEVSKTIEKVKFDVVKEQEIKKVTKTKTAIEEDIRARLRGFSRTIPSFIMAYGKDDLTLANFDTYIPKDVFAEVTGISIGQFKFLRDGGEYEEEGELLNFRGNLFDEKVFNQSILEFLKKKGELANYFEDNEEDIFDYIPPQKTNQIFTPKNIVKLMVDKLEEESPNIYNDSSKTFIDLYMKSGLYITEIVKRLYNSSAIIEEFPDHHNRIKHILENQVFGFAPSEIIYRIAINFIFANFSDSISTRNFIHLDTTPVVKEGKLQQLIDEKFSR